MSRRQMENNDERQGFAKPLGIRERREIELRYLMVTYEKLPQPTISDRGQLQSMIESDTEIQ